MNLSENLKKLRKEYNLSQEDLAEKLNVSRQSISKWEQGLSYPEMDKMLQLCKMFNLNIDELLNKDITKEENNKQSGLNFSKYIEDFLNFISKTINMFLRMKFISIIKCFLEMFFYGVILVILYLIITHIIPRFINGILSFLPYGIVTVISNILTSIISLILFILILIILVHIFKIRYLNYYENYENNVNDEEENVASKVEFKKEKETKIILRDAKNPLNDFFTTLAKIIVFCIKLFLIFVGFYFSLIFIFLCALFILSFLVIKTGAFFIGFIIGIIGCLIGTYIILNLIYNFIISKKSNYKTIGVMFISTLTLLGVGIGFITISMTDFEFSNTNKEEAIRYTMDMKNNIFFTGNYEYIESNNNNIVIKSFDEVYFDCNNSFNYKECYISKISDEKHLFKNIRLFLKEFNKKKILNFYDEPVKIYTSKENIEILKNNSKIAGKLYEEEVNTNEINRLNELNNSLQEELDEKEEIINSLYEKTECNE